MSGFKGGYPIRFACGCTVVCQLLASGYHAADYQAQIDRDGTYCSFCSKGGYFAERRMEQNRRRQAERLKAKEE